jgi:hypothetical protein
MDTEKDFDELYAVFQNECQIGDVVHACAQLIAKERKFDATRSERAQELMTQLAAKHGKPPAVTAMFVLSELIEWLPIK